ncbi:hypothetical protein Bbelb_075290 [Branchiostoma belcheri]|nr:hypothetical protein Bbelb_075290 [Branchiostoma belcheri]
MLQGLNPSKASGPDQIPPWFLKLTASEIAPVLTNIFQHSLNTAEIPKDWRDANICAIFKKGDRAVPSNYRPVSLTCISCKLLEHIIHSQIMKHLESYSILTDYQHGFRAKRSTETQLILTVHDIAGALNSKRQVDLAILDFTKAFDKVPHGRLILKLEYYGIQGPTLNWLKAFLTNREQTVVVEGKASAPVKVASGVPQGTVLGPLLFLLYINDLPDQLDSNVRLFADDCLLYVELSTQTDSQLLQKDLNTLEEWQSKWLMQFNPEKCYIMHITNKRTPHATSYQFCGQALATTKIHPYLGVTLTSGLKWAKSLGARRRRGDMIQVFKLARGLEGIQLESFFKKRTEGSTRGHSCKLEVPLAKGRVRRQSFSVRVVRDWNSLPQAVIDSESVNEFKTNLDKYWESIKYNTE